ncbi:hypothetical protein QUF72_05470 [Desulfobacterales bacterium HSG2]|nr:hypothetical protein [Desulfobacterales bacterium HSG2]
MKKSLLLVAILVFRISGTADAIPIGGQIHGIGSWNIESQRHLAKTFAYGVGGPLDHIDLFADAWEGFPNYPSTFSLVGIVDGSVLSCKETVSDPASDFAAMILLGVALIALARFGKKILTSFSVLQSAGKLS